jgi:hypothetical protein
MKKTKMSVRRSQGTGHRHGLQQETQREVMERLEQQRVDFEHRAHQARSNLYGLAPQTPPRGWIDSSGR